MSDSIPTSKSRGGGRDWAKLLLWTPLLLGGVVAAVLASRAVRLRRAVRKLLAQPTETPETREHLRQAIVGNDKETIAAVFGPPRTAMHRGAGARAASGAASEQYLLADTWYYPYDQAHRTAVVIEFENGVARRAEFIESPVREEKR
jgi:hypothetical protein